MAGRSRSCAATGPGCCERRGPCPHRRRRSGRAGRRRPWREPARALRAAARSCPRRLPAPRAAPRRTWSRYGARRSCPTRAHSRPSAGSRSRRSRPTWHPSRADSTTRAHYACAEGPPPRGRSITTPPTATAWRGAFRRPTRTSPRSPRCSRCGASQRPSVALVPRTRRNASGLRAPPTSTPAGTWFTAVAGALCCLGTPISRLPVARRGLCGAGAGSRRRRRRLRTDRRLRQHARRPHHPHRRGNRRGHGHVRPTDLSDPDQRRTDSPQGHRGPAVAFGCLVVFQGHRQREEAPLEPRRSHREDAPAPGGRYALRQGRQGQARPRRASRPTYAEGGAPARGR